MTFDDYLNDLGIGNGTLTPEARAKLEITFNASNRPLRAKATSDPSRVAELRAIADEARERYTDGASAIDLCLRAALADPTMTTTDFANYCEREGTMHERIDNRPRTIRGSGAVTDNTLRAGFLLHLGRRELAEKAYGAESCERADSLRCRCTLDLMQAALRAKSIDIPYTDHEIIRAAFGPSTADFGSIVGGSLERIALEAYQTANPTWPLFAKEVSVKDFRSTTLIRVNWLGDLEIVAPGGEIHHGSADTSEYSVRADTRGKLFIFDRQSIINDDLSMLTSVAEGLGRMASRAISDAVWTALLGNAGSFFADANANYLDTAASALSIPALSAAIALMRAQTGPAGDVLDLVPRTLCVGPSLEATGRTILNSTLVARDTTSTDSLPMGSPLPPNLALAVEARIENARFTGNSTTRWYLFASPADSVITVAFLNNQKNPTIQQVDPGPNVLGVGYRGFLDFGVALADPKSAVMAVGA